MSSFKNCKLNNFQQGNLYFIAGEMGGESGARIERMFGEMVRNQSQEHHDDRNRDKNYNQTSSQYGNQSRKQQQTAAVGVQNINPPDQGQQNVNRQTIKRKQRGVIKVSDGLKVKNMGSPPIKKKK